MSPVLIEYIMDVYIPIVAGTTIFGGAMCFIFGLSRVDPLATFKPKPWFFCVGLALVCTALFTPSRPVMRLILEAL